MQQTDKYKLNLIETSDVFSPNSLNENMEKVEAAIQDGLATAAAGDAAEAQARITADTAEAQTRAQADTAEAQARAQADAAEAQARADADTAEAQARAALDQRVTVLEAHKIFTGSYAGSGVGIRTISLGVTPKLVFIRQDKRGGSTIIMEGAALYDSSGNTPLECIVSGGFQIDTSINMTNTTYHYLAIV